MAGTHVCCASRPASLWPRIALFHRSSRKSNSAYSAVNAARNRFTTSTAPSGRNFAASPITTAVPRQNASVNGSRAYSTPITTSHTHAAPSTQRRSRNRNVASSNTAPATELPRYPAEKTMICRNTPTGSREKHSPD